jgi:hypothetical protein
VRDPFDREGLRKEKVEFRSENLALNAGKAHDHEGPLGRDGFSFVRKFFSG